MTLLISLIDLFIILVLLRFLIKPNEAYFDPIYRLIYRVTDPVMKAASYAVSGAARQVMLSVAALVLIRGLLYATGTASAATGIGMSLLDLFKLLFQVYMVAWFISVLSGWSYRTSLQGMIDRAFHPFNRLSWRFRVKRNQYHVFVLVILFALYVLLSGVIRFFLYRTGSVSVFPFGLLEAFLLVLSLFPFPGFFSLIIIIGALLSWVSPDPSNSIVSAIYGISEPLLMPFRRIIPTLGGIDISPIVALLCFQLIGSLGNQIIAAFMRA